jgi:hypothetical protein
MADERKGTIELGSVSYGVGPMTLSQMRELGIGSMRMITSFTDDKVANEVAWYDSTFEMLGFVLVKTPEEIGALTGVNFEQLQAARAEILRVAGLVPDKKETAPQGKAGETLPTG